MLRLLPWEDEHLNPEGVVERVLGPSGDPRVEVDAVAFAFGLPPSFPEDVEREAGGFPGRRGRPRAGAPGGFPRPALRHHRPCGREGLRRRRFDRADVRTGRSASACISPM